MSYSRWGNSVWYTFNACSDAKVIDDEIFEIIIAIGSPTTGFTYREIKDDIDKCIDKVKAICAGHVITNPEDYDELKIYMKRFMKDMEKDLAKWKEMEVDKIHMIKLKLIRIITNSPPCDHCKYRCVFHYCPHWQLKQDGVDF